MATMAMNKNERAEYAERLRARFQELKEDEDLTQEQLADDSSMSTRAVWAFLSGEGVPNESTLHKYGKALRIEPDAEAVRQKWEKYSGLFNLLYLYLEGHPVEEHREIRMRILDALGLENSNNE